MRVYLACTVRGSRSGVAAARLVAERLAALGHEVLTLHLLQEDVDGAEATLAESAVFERDVRWLDGCDALVAEASGSTYGVGFEVGYVTARARETGQHVYLLYEAARRHAVSRLALGNTNPACTVLAYTGLDEVAAFVDRHFGPGAKR